MTGNATRSWRCASAGVAAGVLALLATPGLARQDDRVGVGDIALAPLADFNLRRDPIPPALLRARLAPYASEGLDNCVNILEEIGNLDAVLGEDFDTAAPEEERSLSAGKIAKDAFTSLIPYRGVVRELTGANDHEANFRQAIAAGLVRRAYLKGLGQAQGCPYPARPSLAGIFIQPEADPELGPELAEATGGREVEMVAHPVIQGEP